ncbi:MAG: hypothetical protein ABI664_22960 [bacterium]
MKLSGAAAALLVALWAVGAGCRRESDVSIRRDDGRNRKMRDEPAPSPFLPPLVPPRWDVKDGELVMIIEVDEFGEVRNGGVVMSDDDLRDMCRDAKATGKKVRAEIVSDAKAKAVLVRDLFHILTAAGVTSLTFKSKGGGPVALTIGGGSSLTIGGGTATDAGSD